MSGSLPDVERVAPSSYAIDRVKGQPAAKRAVEIAVAGGHNLLLTGPPGTGKTMLARSAIQLFPLLSRSEHIDVMHIRSIAGLPLPFLGRPFREPHHTLSAASLVGGIQGRPGELALASKGVLFLDEFPHLPRESLEALRQPMQDKRVRLIKRGVEYEYPADCLIIAAQNNCPCGLTGLEGRSCHCTARDILRYRHAVSEPLLDRFDIFCEVPQPDPERVLGQDDDLSGSVMAARIQRARSVRAERGHGVGEGRQLSRPVSDLLEKAGTAFGLSARALDSLVRVARTIGDLEGADQVKAGHVQEALQYRRGPGIPL